MNNKVIKTSKGKIRVRDGLAVAGGIFVLTGVSLVAPVVFGASTTSINWPEVVTISSATAATGTLLTSLYCYRDRVLKELKQEKKSSNQYTKK